MTSSSSSFLLVLVLSLSSFLMVSCFPEVEVNVTVVEGGHKNFTHPHQILCKEDADCKPYSQCHSSAFLGRVCHTNFRQKHNHTSCESKDKSGSPYPNHSTCREEESTLSGIEPKYTTARCYKELNYTCQRSNYMPCTPNYDLEGAEVKGEELSCPENFKCTPKTYGSGADNNSTEVHLCVPVPPAEVATVCKDHFECGYSFLQHTWSKCTQGECLRIHE